MGKVTEWLRGQVSKDRALEGEITPVYTEADRREAPSGHLPLPGTDVEIVAYPVNADDLMVLVNKGDHEADAEARRLGAAAVLELPVDEGSLRAAVTTIVEPSPSWRGVA